MPATPLPSADGALRDRHGQLAGALNITMPIGSETIKDAVARREFAPVGLLADVLGMAASEVVDRIDQLEGQLRKACPDLPDEARTVVQTVIASARNEWIRSTANIVCDGLDAMVAAPDEEDQEAPEPDEGGAP